MSSSLQKQNVYAVAYRRVSDQSQLHGTSPENQEMKLRQTADRLQCQLWPNNEIFLEAHTGSENNRPVYDALFQQIIEAKKNGVNIKYFIIHVIDRFTRGGASSYEGMKDRLSQIGVELIDSYGIIQPKRNTLEHLGFDYDWSIYAPSEMAEIMEALRAKFEKRDILTRMISGEIIRAKAGYKVRSPHDGFINKKVVFDPSTGKQATIQVPDPERAKYYQAMFRLRANPDYTKTEVVQQVNAMGFRTKRKNRWSKDKKQIIGHFGEHPLTEKQLDKIIRKPIYAGVVCEKWTSSKPIKAPYEGLVSIDTFNRANRGAVIIHELPDGSISIQRGNEKRNYQHNKPQFKYKNVVKCPICRKFLKGSFSRSKTGKRHGYYHCSRGHKHIGIPIAKMDATVRDFINELKFTDELKKKVLFIITAAYREKEASMALITAKANEHVAELERKKASYIESFSFARTEIVRSDLENKIQEIQKRIEAAMNSRDVIEVSEKNISDFITFAAKLVEHPANFLEKSGDIERQRLYFSLIFEDFPTYEELQSGTPSLTPIFKLRKDFEEGKDEKSLLASLQGQGWNPWESEILRWIPAILTTKQPSLG